MTYKEYLEMLLAKLISTQNKGCWAGICVHNRILRVKLEHKGIPVHAHHSRLMERIIKEISSSCVFLDSSFWWRAKHGYVGHKRHLTPHMRMEMRIRYIRKLIQKEES